MDRALTKILVSNRGEIALRIIRAIHGLHKKAIVVHSYQDRSLPFVSEADEAWSLGRGSLADTYLHMEKIIGIATQSGADAIHPGYGFLAENAEFAELCNQSGICFIGPTPENIRIMGDKAEAREKAKELGIPVLEGFAGNPGEIIRRKDRLSYPVLVKPTAGGGGKGMRIVRTAEDLTEAVEGAVREAQKYFGIASLYVEHYLENPRHIEVQVMADHLGNMVHLFERECSVQRRYQKIIEEAPSQAVNPELREALTGCALALVRGIGYRNAGTVEFLVDASGAFYFLEMNTRIQVEHPVTEMITGVDLVSEQISVGEGQPLSFDQSSLQMRGHAMEARIYAEDPLQGFMPSAGRIGTFESGTGERLDTGYEAGNAVESYYDPLLAKLIVHGKNREEARKKLISGLKNIHITGLSTNRDFLVALAGSGAFASNAVHTRFLDLGMESMAEELHKSRAAFPGNRLLPAAAMIATQPDFQDGHRSISPWDRIGYWRFVPGFQLHDGEKDHAVGFSRLHRQGGTPIEVDGKIHVVELEKKNGSRFRIRVDGKVLDGWSTVYRAEVILDLDGRQFRFVRSDILDERYMGTASRHAGQITDRIEAPLNGRVVQVHCREGESVKKGQSLVVIESMKMENKVLAPHDLTIKKTFVTPGEQVRTNQLLFTLATYD